MCLHTPSPFFLKFYLSSLCVRERVCASMRALICEFMCITCRQLPIRARRGSSHLLELELQVAVSRVWKKLWVNELVNMHCWSGHTLWKTLKLLTLKLAKQHLVLSKYRSDLKDWSVWTETSNFSLLSDVCSLRPLNCRALLLRLFTPAMLYIINRLRF